ncbi:M56 family metallopeptidase [uncultured Winogradskyella sp.]|uniref:M56 family metallopeptidase n=1 Tax=uncultured Winogradskyella sp. TaxID=395353 RepID=UPI0026264D1D|nr:M56 family metallopeptidase [uncultured Winogradskyella sp.]
MEYLLKASAVVCIFYLCFQLVLKEETFFNHNRWFLLLGLVVALVFPFIVIPVYIPIETMSLPIYLVEPTESIANYTPQNIEQPFNWVSLIPILYFIGFGVLCLQFLFQFVALILLFIKNPKTKDGIYTYIKINQNISPFSFFKWIFFNPNNFDKEELALIITHEKVHGNQLHSIDVLFIQLACVLFWFNPFIWLYRNKIRQNLEYIADKKTQTVFKDNKAYQHLLLKTSVINTTFSLSNNFYNSQIKKRIVMLQKSKSNTNRKWRYLLSLPLLATLLLSMNTKEIYIQSKTPHKSFNPDALNQKEKNPIRVVFTKETTDNELKNIKADLMRKGITMTIKKLKRNNKGYIIAINVEFKTDTSSANYKATVKSGIKSFYFKVDANGNFGVSIINETKFVIAEPLVTNGKNNDTLNTKTKVFVFNEDQTEAIILDSTRSKIWIQKHNENVENFKKTITKDSVYFKAIDSSEVMRLTKEKSNIYYEDNSNTSQLYNNPNALTNPGQLKQKKSIYINSDNTEPLIILDGKVLKNRKLMDINADSIEKVDVLKGDTATKLYGDNGKHGVIIITSKNKKKPLTYIKVKKGKTKKDEPWKIGRIAVTSTFYEDDKNPNKNSQLAYISKYTSDEILDSHKTNLKKIGLTVKYSKLKRNKKGEITRIKISIKNEKNSESSTTWQNNNGIDGIEFGESKGSLIARTSDMNKN